MREWFAWARRRDDKMAQWGGRREDSVIGELMLARVGQDCDEALDERERPKDESGCAIAPRGHRASIGAVTRIGPPSAQRSSHGTDATHLGRGIPVPSLGLGNQPNLPWLPGDGVRRRSFSSPDAQGTHTQCPRTTRSGSSRSVLDFPAGIFSPADGLPNNPRIVYESRLFSVPNRFRRGPSESEAATRAAVLLATNWLLENQNTDGG